MVPVCSSSTLTIVLPHWNAMPHCHTIQTQGWPVVLSIDVERHTGIHNFPFSCLRSDPIGKSFPDLPLRTLSALLINFK